ncbi:dihydroorotase [Trueperella pyogenes]|uniref:dihydroorotase n=1 Tax=Trueperella pyogenes TaxID=1661 RepID=UPI0032440439
MNLVAELRAHRQLEEVKTLLERGILTVSEAIAVCARLDQEDTPLAGLQRARFVDYLEGLSDVWIQPENLV